jgi:hypothetical protein
MQASGPQSPRPISIPTLLRQTVERIPNQLALGICPKFTYYVLFGIVRYQFVAFACRENV